MKGGCGLKVDVSLVPDWKRVPNGRVIIGEGVEGESPSKRVGEGPYMLLLGAD